MHNIGNNAINANFVLPYIIHLQFSSLFTPHEVSKCEIKSHWVLKVFILKLLSLLILLISNVRAKTNLAILSFLYCGDFLKTLYVVAKTEVSTI